MHFLYLSHQISLVIDGIFMIISITVPSRNNYIYLWRIFWPLFYILWKKMRAPKYHKRPKQRFIWETYIFSPLDGCSNPSTSNFNFKSCQQKLMEFKLISQTFLEYLANNFNDEHFKIRLYLWNALMYLNQILYVIKHCLHL